MNEEHRREYTQLLTMRRTFEFLDEIKRRREKPCGLGEKGLKRPSGLPNNRNGDGGSGRRGRGRDSSRGGEL
jgi:hypothetical protein